MKCNLPMYLIVEINRFNKRFATQNEEKKRKRRNDESTHLERHVLITLLILLFLDIISCCFSPESNVECWPSRSNEYSKHQEGQEGWQT